MARITMLAPDQLDPELWRRSKADECTAVELDTTRISGISREVALQVAALVSRLV